MGGRAPDACSPPPWRLPAEVRVGAAPAGGLCPSHSHAPWQAPPRLLQVVHAAPGPWQQRPTEDTHHFRLLRGHVTLPRGTFSTPGVSGCWALDGHRARVSTWAQSGLGLAASVPRLGFWTQLAKGKWKMGCESPSFFFLDPNLTITKAPASPRNSGFLASHLYTWQVGFPHHTHQPLHPASSVKGQRWGPGVHSLEDSCSQQPQRPCHSALTQHLARVAQRALVISPSVPTAHASPFPGEGHRVEWSTLAGGTAGEDRSPFPEAVWLCSPHPCPRQRY